MLQDEKEYPNPESFDPERYVNNGEGPISPTDIIFGFGRRFVHLNFLNTYVDRVR